MQWVVGTSGDQPPTAAAQSKAATTVHYMIADGCVHVYGGAVGVDAIVRQESVPLGPNGHQFPDWL